MTTINTPDTLKTIREALCLAQSALYAWPHSGDRPTDRADILGHLIADIDRQRPLAADGKHTGRDLCTPTCGCEGQAETAWACERCGSHRWTGWRAGPEHEGFQRFAQCVPCGHVQAVTMTNSKGAPEMAEESGSC